MIKKILKLLTPFERKRLLLLLGMMVSSALVEVAGIASIMPFLSLVSNQNIINTNKFLNYFYTLLNFQSVNKFLVFIGSLVLFIIILSNLLIFLSTWGLERFSWMRSHSISLRLLKNYLYQPYKFFINQNTSLLGKNILSEVQTAVKGVIIPLLEIFSKGVVALFILIMLISIEPILAIAMMGSLGFIYLLVYRIIKRRLIIRGKVRSSTNAERFKAVSETFGDIKLLKLRHSEDYFLRRFEKPSLKFARVNANTHVIGLIPKYIIEVIAFGGIIILLIYLLLTGRGLNSFLPVIGVYAFSIYRLLPSIQSIFSSIAQVRYNLKGLDIVYEDMFSFDNINVINFDKSKVPIQFKEELVFKNITFTYPGAKRPTIRDLSFKVEVNTSVAFVGLTGAGKTTIANIILGLLRPDSGCILVDDIEINDENLFLWQMNLGYIPQDIYLQDDTIKRNITFGIPNNQIDMNAVIRAAKIANIHDFIINELPDKYETVIGEKGIRLSGGQRQRIGIARAVYHNPSVLVLDEATSALDNETEREVFEAISNIAKTKTLIIIAHRITTVQNCDVIYVLDNGVIVDKGKYNELLETSETFIRLTGKNRKRAIL